MLSETMGENEALLVGVLSGGCSATCMTRSLRVKAPLVGEIEVSGFRIQIPNVASHLLNGIGSVVDKLMGGGFKINNPNASNFCGCGESFS